MHPNVYMHTSDRAKRKTIKPLNAEIDCSRMSTSRVSVVALVLTWNLGVVVQASKVPCIIFPMQLATETVVGGQIAVEGDTLPEGAVVTILAREADETFQVPPEVEAELLESIAQAERGETISAEELLKRLRQIA
jgi:hypothetical protein